MWWSKRTRQRDQVMGPGNAKPVFSSVLNRYGIAKEIREHRILIHWDKIVGPRVAGHTTPDALSKGTLWVRVDSSSWMHQLSFLNAEILAKANEVCGEQVVEKLRFHLGRQKATTTSHDALSAAAKIRRPPAPQRPMPDPAMGIRLEEIIEEASGIEDDALRDAIVDIRRRLNL